MWILIGECAGILIGCAGILFIGRLRERRMHAHYRELARQRLARFDAHCAWIKTASNEELDRNSAEADARWRARGL